MNLATLVDQKAAQFGDRVLAIFDDDTVTYAQVAERAGTSPRACGTWESPRATGSRS